METAERHLAIGQAHSSDQTLVLVRGSQAANVRVDGLGVLELAFVFRVGEVEEEVWGR